MAYTVVVAGSTHRTLQCLQALAVDARFEITAAVTPAPKKIGRQQLLTENPVHVWANQQTTPAILVEKRIDISIKDKLKKIDEPDFLLVVDFGYIVPQWLLEYPGQASINIHPSALPKWRGSSPAQFALLYGEAESAVTIMIMNAELDAGPILTQLPFTVSESWTQTQYYEYSFNLATKALPNTLAAFAQEELDPKDQPTQTPTPIARRLTKQDSYVPWEVVSAAMTGDSVRTDQLSALLQAALTAHPSPVHLLVAASKAFQPWPTLWTLVPTPKGEVRMKLLELDVIDDLLLLKKVHVAGRDKPAPWNQVKSILSE